MAVGRVAGKLLLAYRRHSGGMAWDVAMVEIWNATTAQALPDSAVATSTSLDPMLAKHQKPCLFCTNPRRFSFLIMTV